MKQMAASCILLFMLLTGIFGICQEMEKQFYTEGENLALEDAVRHSLMALSDGQDEQKPLTKEEVYEIFLEDLMLELGEKCAYEVQIYELDTTQGILDAGVSVTYKDIYGEEKTVNARKKGRLEVKH